VIACAQPLCRRATQSHFTIREAKAIKIVCAIAIIAVLIFTAVIAWAKPTAGTFAASFDHLVGAG
jgi:hypothetical protein